MYKAGIITASDKGSQGLREDKGGPAIREILSGFADTFEVVDYRIVPDEKVRLTSAMIDMADIQKIDLIVTTGGTGFSKRDVTPEAPLEVIAGYSGSHEKHQPRRHYESYALPRGSGHSRQFHHHQSSRQSESYRRSARSDSSVCQTRSGYSSGKRLGMRAALVYKNKETDRNRVRARKRSDPVS